MNINIVLIIQILMVVPAVFFILAAIKLFKTKSVPGTALIAGAAVAYIASFFFMAGEEAGYSLASVVLQSATEFLPVLLFSIGFYKLANYAVNMHLTSQSTLTPNDSAGV